MSDWDTITAFARSKAEALGDEYTSRLEYEFKEIEKQGANQYWTDLLVKQEKFDKNPNGIVLAYLLGITSVDPITEKIDHNIELQPDMPDIDLDLLPQARDPIKKYAAEKYGADHVCSVGSWVTYKTKQALKDAASALGFSHIVVNDITTKLPDEFDEMTLAQALEDESSDFDELRNYDKRTS